MSEQEILGKIFDKVNDMDVKFSANEAKHEERYKTTKETLLHIKKGLSIHLNNYNDDLVEFAQTKADLTAECEARSYDNKKYVRGVLISGIVLVSTVVGIIAKVQGMF